MQFLQPTHIDKEIGRLVEEMSTMDVCTEEYRNAANNLKTLYEARANKSSTTISPEVVVTALANLLGILLIIHYEQANVLTSKALGQLFRRS